MSNIKCLKEEQAIGLLENIVWEDLLKGEEENREAWDLYSYMHTNRHIYFLDTFTQTHTHTHTPAFIHLVNRYVPMLFFARKLEQNLSSIQIKKTRMFQEALGYEVFLILT